MSHQREWWSTLLAVHFAVAVLGCGGSTPDDETALSARDTTSPETNPFAHLSQSEDPYARAHADLLSAALADARRASASAQSLACSSDADAQLGALVALMEQRPSVAVNAVRALSEIRLSLEACDRSSCADEDLGLDTRSKTALLLEVPEAASADGRAHPMVAGAAAEARQDWSAALDAYGEVLATVRCSTTRADTLRRFASVERRVSGPAASRRTIVRALGELPDGSSPRIRGDLLLERGYTFAAERNYEDALASYSEAERAYEQLGDLAPLYVADAQNATAVALGQLGRITDALRLNEQVLALRARVLGEAHPLTLISMSNIAVMANGAGRTQKALDIHQRILGIRSRVLEPNDPALAVSLDAIGGILTRNGRAQEAIPFCQQSVEIRESGHPDARVDRPRSHVCLANAFFAAGRVEEALREATTAVEQAREAQGRHHPDVADYLLLQARIAEHGGNTDLAADSTAEALRIRERRTAP